MSQESPADAGSLATSLWRRRLPHLLLAYCGGVWALIEVASFSVGRYGLADAWVDRVLVAGLVLLPMVAWIGWRIGAEGPTQWRRRDLLPLLASLILVGVLTSRIPSDPDAQPHASAGNPTQSPEPAGNEGATRVTRKPAVLLGPIRTEASDPKIQEVANSLPVLIETDLAHDERLWSSSYVSQGVRGAWATLIAQGISDPRKAEAGAWRGVARLQRRDVLVLGSLSEKDQSWLLRLQLLRFQPEESTETIEVTAHSPIELVDAAAATLRTALAPKTLAATGDPAFSLISSETWPVLADFARARDLQELQANPAAAVTVYESVLARAPTFAQARWHLVGALYQAEHTESMKSNLDALLRQLDQLPRLLRFQVQIYDARTRQDSAAQLEILKLWAAQDQDAIEPQFALAWAQYRKEGQQEHLDTLKTLAQRDATVDNLVRVSQLLDERGNDDAARSLRDEAMARAPSETAAFLAQAYADVNAGRLEDAETNFRKVLAIDPNHLASKLALAQVPYHRGDFEQALSGIRSILQASTLPGPRIEATQALGNILANLGRHKEAVEAWRDVHAFAAAGLNPTDRINLIEANWSDAIGAAEGQDAANQFIDATIRLDDAAAQRFYRVQLRFRAAISAFDYVSALHHVDAVTEAYRQFRSGGMMPSEPYVPYLQAANHADDPEIIDRMLEADARFEASLHKGDFPLGRFRSFRMIAIPGLIRAGRLKIAKEWIDAMRQRAPHAPVTRLMEADWLLASRRPDEAMVMLVALEPVIRKSDSTSHLHREYDRILKGVQAYQGR